MTRYRDAKNDHCLHDMPGPAPVLTRACAMLFSFRGAGFAVSRAANCTPNALATVRPAAMSV